MISDLYHNGEWDVAAGGAGGNDVVNDNDDFDKLMIMLMDMILMMMKEWVKLRRKKEDTALPGSDLYEEEVDREDELQARRK